MVLADTDLVFLQQNLLNCNHQGSCLCVQKFDLLIRFSHAGIPKRFWKKDTPVVLEHDFIRLLKNKEAALKFSERGYGAVFTGLSDPVKEYLFCAAKKFILAGLTVRCLALEDLKRYFGRFEDDNDDWEEYMELDVMIIHDMEAPRPGDQRRRLSNIISTKVCRLVSMRTDALKSVILGSMDCREDLLLNLNMSQNTSSFLVP